MDLDYTPEENRSRLPPLSAGRRSKRRPNSEDLDDY